MNRRIRRKTNGPFVFGDFSSAFLLGYEKRMNQLIRQMELGYYRHSKKKEKIIKRIQKLEYIIWDIKTKRVRRRKLMERSWDEVGQFHGDDEMINQMPRISKEIDNEFWRNRHEV